MTTQWKGPDDATKLPAPAPAENEKHPAAARYFPEPPALADSERRFRSMVKLSSEWYWEQDENFRFTYLSADERQGFSPPELVAAVVGKCRWEGVGLSPVQGSWDDHRAVLAAHQPFTDFQYMRSQDGGHPRYYSATGEPVFDGTGRFSGYRGTGRDITESRIAIEFAQATADRLTTTLESLTDAFISFDRSWRFTYVNTRAEELLDTPRADLLGKVKWEVFPEAKRSVFAKHYRKAMDENVTVVCEEFHKHAGIWVQVKIYPSQQGLAIFFRDISERVLAQREIMQLNAELEDRVTLRTAELEAANKELQFFAYSIAHDLRGPLSVMDGFGCMLEKSAGDGLSERSRHYLSRMRAGARHMGELTDGLLELAKLSRAELRDEAVDLALLARAALQACRDGSPARAVEAVVPLTLPAHGDSRLLAQVFGNLVGNAWKFTSKVTAARIEIGCRPATGKEGPVYFVRDNGAGFDATHATHLFEPFQRLHAASDFEGTGIGLALVRKILSRHGGRIWAESQTGEGATFYFTLAPRLGFGTVHTSGPVTLMLGSAQNDTKIGD